MPEALELRLELPNPGPLEKQQVLLSVISIVVPLDAGVEPRAFMCARREH